MKRVAVYALIIFATSCSEGPAAFEVDGVFPNKGATPLQLTYNTGEDRTPAWSAGSDSIYYWADSYSPFPPTSGIILAVPRTGGSARTLFNTSVFFEPTRIAPAVDSDHDRVAYFELTRNWQYKCAVIMLVTPDGPVNFDTHGLLPLLREAELKVRPLDRSATDAAELPINFTGRLDDGGSIVIEGALFQREYTLDRSAVFRGSWSPDGNRVVFSDGKQLLIWTVGAAGATPIPNTENGVWPAWSPDGEWIAFTRLQPGLKYKRTLMCVNPGFVEFYEVTSYEPSASTPGSPVLELIRLDGTEGRALGVGEAPAWTPDSDELVFARANQLWRTDLQGAASPILHTDGGREPAVSPDAKWVAFTRLNSTFKTRDVWVAPL